MDVLRREQGLAALLPEVFRCDRLVLLGDVLELRQGPVREALSAAEPVLREIGAALGPASEMVIVPGNHDHHLAARVAGAPGARREPPPLGLESAVDWEPGETLATVASWLEPARVRAAYPGVWLRDDVYAIHGHYADRHTTVPMFERLGAGAMARLARDAATGPARAEDYEAIARADLRLDRRRRPEPDDCRQAQQRRGILARVAHAVERRPPAPQHAPDGAQARVPGSHRGAQPRRPGTAEGRHLGTPSCGGPGCWRWRRRCDASG